MTQTLSFTKPTMVNRTWLDPSPPPSPSTPPLKTFLLLPLTHSPEPNPTSTPLKIYFFMLAQCSKSFSSAPKNHPFPKINHPLLSPPSPQPYITTTHFEICDYPLQLHISQEGHMQLMTSEFLNLFHHKGRSIAKPNHFND